MSTNNSHQNENQNQNQGQRQGRNDNGNRNQNQSGNQDQSHDRTPHQRYYDNGVFPTAGPVREMTNSDLGRRGIWEQNRQAYLEERIQRVRWQILQELSRTPTSREESEQIQARLEELVRWQAYLERQR
ncbi:hypothetical protein K505DRAFT_338121 [Melanomma pulvis-pyrius CBS 109.77]|uniref:Uncharacterized protein n=1 Tax=Melanomma pulvis-pyrius CBS 109.77 TaxID=1314802 RepID=A0A6A6XAX1_9PLEO|nr:hypothetical protein K505DRAFT_338121 [Melanomma pulvis-pyrius CBS 109.77]